MKPLQSIAMGLVIVALVARTHGHDVLADPLGWLLVLRGVRGLPRSLPLLGTVHLLSGLALLVSVPLWFPGFVDAVADTDVSLLWALNLPQIVFVAALCVALARAATAAGDTRRAGWLRTGCTLTVGAGVLPIVVYAVEPDLLVPMLLLALLSLVLVIVLLFRYAARPWALPEVDQTAPHPEGIDS